MGDLVKVDGSTGEGGGQVLRLSVALSAATQRPVHVTRIRAGRRNPSSIIFLSTMRRESSRRFDQDSAS